MSGEFAKERSPMTHDNRGEHQVIDKAVSATADRGAMLLWLINDIAFLSMLFLEPDLKRYCNNHFAAPESQLCTFG
jgi:hypothetical protein